MTLRSFKRLWEIIGPVILSVLSLYISFIIIQPIAVHLDFSLLANKGIGKSAFVTMAIIQIMLFLSIYPKSFLYKILNLSIFMFLEKQSLYKAAKFFCIFALLHISALFIFYLSGYVYIVNNWGELSFSLIFGIPRGILFSIFVVFILAWYEETIFRNVLYSYFEQFYNPIISIITVSVLFMASHDLVNPINLITTEWKLGLGLFLLGMLLNLIFFATKNLYANIGAHMGLVSIKVFLRRVPIAEFTSEKLPFWINSDLRQSLLIHISFIIVIIAVIIRLKKALFYKVNAKKALL